MSVVYPATNRSLIFCAIADAFRNTLHWYSLPRASSFSLIWIDLCHELASDSVPSDCALAMYRAMAAPLRASVTNRNTFSRVDPPFGVSVLNPKKNVESIGLLLQFLAQLLDFRTLLVAGVWFGGVEDMQQNDSQLSSSSASFSTKSLRVCS